MHRNSYLNITNKTTTRIERTATKPADGAIINIGFKPSDVSNGFEGTYSETNHMILHRKVLFSISFLFNRIQILNMHPFINIFFSEFRNINNAEHTDINAVSNIFINVVTGIRSY